MKAAAYLCSLVALLLAASLCVPLQLPLQLHEPLDHDAYVWQRQWRPEVGAAIRQNRDLVRAWRILLAHISAAGELQSVSPDIAALQASRRPVIAVIRIEGQINHFDENILRQQVLHELERLRAAHLEPAGVEIDHDCARSQLARYAAFLQNLRKAFPTRLPLSITALPDWLESDQLAEVLAQTDESVLQVHAVENPRRGLFDPLRAAAWIKRYAKISRHAFRVALPAYGAQLRFDAYGNLAGVQSEMPLLGDVARTREVIVPPRLIQTFIRELERSRPPNLAGIAWFRLPVAGDRRAWNPRTWRTVVTGAPLNGTLRVSTRQHNDGLLFDIILANPSDIDLEKPQAIALPKDCAVADGLNGYDFIATGTNATGTLTANSAAPVIPGPSLQARQMGLIPPGRQFIVGWARCSHSPGPELHARN
jgi:hypothetical protein